MSISRHCKRGRETAMQRLMWVGQKRWDNSEFTESEKDSSMYYSN